MTKIDLALDRLECRVQGDASGGSEPYLWPMLLWVTDATIQTPTPVRSNHPHTPRSVLGQDVRAGAVLSVPAAAGRTGTQLPAGEVLRSAIVVVSLLENDETPHHVVVAAYDEYVRALPAAITAHLLELASADPDVVDAATAAVRKEVGDAVKRAGANEMTTWEKFKVGIGSLNLDDEVGAAFTDSTTTRPLALVFRTTAAGSTRVDQDWLLTGTLTVDTRIDLCAGQEQAVARATVRRAEIRSRLQALQTQFAQASAQERPAIRMDIDEARAELAAAEADLANAEAALARCRAGGRRPTTGEVGPVITASGTTRRLTTEGRAATPRLSPR